MRVRNPTMIVREYLDLGEPVQVRKNALTALAALGDAESLEILVETALNDRDVQVRERAEAEIASLPADQCATALSPVLDGLKEADGRDGAYALLGRLRSRGISLQFPRLGIWTRLRLAKLLRDSVYPNRGFRFHFRTFKGIAAGMLPAVLMLLFYLRLKVDAPFTPDFLGGMIGLYLISWAVALPIIVLATLFVTPLRYHADIFGAALLDILMAAVASSAFPGLGFFFAISDRQDQLSFFGMAAFVMCTAAVAAGAVRAGTLAACDVFRGKWTGYLTRFLAGGLSGVAVYDLAMIAYGNTGDTFAAFGWMWTLVAGFGLSGAYVKIDGEVRARPVASRGARVAVGALATLALLIGLIAIRPLPETRIEAGAITKLPKEFALRNVPARIQFETRSPVEVKADDSLYTVEVKSLEKGTGSLTGKLEASVAHNSKVRSGDFWGLLPQLTKLLSWPQIRARIRRTEPIGGPVMVNVSIDLPKEKQNSGK